VSEKGFAKVLGAYERCLRVVLRHPAITLMVLLLTIAVNIFLFVVVPKGFFPQQDNGTIMGGVQGAQDASFPAMQSATARFVNIIKDDPAVQNVIAFTGGGGAANSGFVFWRSSRSKNANSARIRSLPGCGPSSTPCRAHRCFCRPARICASAGE
jgi:multidrug efflux pump